MGIVDAVGGMAVQHKLQLAWYAMCQAASTGVSSRNGKQHV